MANLLNKLFGNNDQALAEGQANNGAAPIHVADSQFQELVLESELPVVVDFWAPWCMPCKMITPVLEKLAAEYNGRVLIAKVNTDENPQWAIHFGVQGIPTLLFVKDGQVADRVVGVVPAGQVKDRLEQLLPKPH